jgi:hypothetical protein|tara:strand:+ start:827 stop:1021 length:195 start_codon:yes stop_codon:yes gene_type:complete
MYYSTKNQKDFRCIDNGHYEKADNTAERFGNKDLRGNNGMQKKMIDNLAQPEDMMYSMIMMPRS